MNDLAIVATDLTYSYGQNKAVDQISFEVGQGEILGFLGPNGAGKTTTVKLLTGQIKPSAGKALLMNIDVSQHPNKVQEQIGVAFETNNLYEQMTAIENLKLFARLFGVQDFKPQAMLERVGLGGRGKEPVAGFSKGMRQRLMLVRALVNRPRILFLDEPTDGLDPVSSETIRNLIKEQSDNGTSVFLTTHDMVEADKLCDRVAFINQGKIEALNTPQSLKQQFGKRALKVELVKEDGARDSVEVILDQPDTPRQIESLFANSRVETVHSAEATLEDIFVRITGRALH